MSVAEAWGMRCPNCQLDDMLEIHVLVTVRLTTDGTEPVDGDHEWTPESGCMCMACDWTGTVNQTRIGD